MGHVADMEEKNKCTHILVGKSGGERTSVDICIVNGKIILKQIVNTV
jgi:hypothetical protein